MTEKLNNGNDITMGSVSGQKQLCWKVAGDKVYVTDRGGRDETMRIVWYATIAVASGITQKAGQLCSDVCEVR